MRNVNRFAKVCSMALSVVLAASMAACSGTGKPEGTAAAGGLESSQNTADKVEISVWVRDSTVKAVRAAADSFNETSDKVHVNVVEQPAKQMAEQFSLALSANEAPDIISLDCTKVPYFASVGSYKDISSRFNELSFKDSFSEGMLNLGKYNEALYAIPFAPDVSVLLYNKDHYIEAGLDPEVPPTTWEELIDYSQKLTNEDHYGYVFAGGHASAYMFTVMPYVWNNGGELLNEDGSKCLLNESHAIESLKLFDDLTNKYKVTPPSVTSYSWTEAQDAFLTQKSSMVVLGSAAIYSFISGENEMNWGAVLIPRGPSGSAYASFSGGDSIGIVSQSTYEEEAWQFIQHALSEEVQVHALAKDGLLPARSDLFDNEYFESTPEYQILREALTVGRAPYSLKYDEMYDPVLEKMQSALNQEMTLEEAVASIAEKIDSIMAS